VVQPEWNGVIEERGSEFSAELRDSSICHFFLSISIAGRRKHRNSSKLIEL
jgi:hypothetical protein